MQTNNNDPIWTRRTGGSANAQRPSGRASTSNMTDVSVSSASLNSPVQSSQAASEASSYATRGVPGVIDELDEHSGEQDVEDDNDGEEEEDMLVVARSSTSNANRRHRRPVIPPGSEGATEEDEDEQREEQEDANIYNHNEGTSASHFSSRLLDESEEDELMNGTTGGGYNAHLNGDADSLADASPEEVEARASEVIGWDTVGNDVELYVVDLDRWKHISDKHSMPGTPEHQAVKAIQAELLTAVQEMEATEWMYPEPLPFSTYLPEPSSTIGQKPQSTLPFHTDDFHGGSNVATRGGKSWCDLAFNPLSTFTPLAPVGQATYPDTYRVQRALGVLPSSLPSTSTSFHRSPLHLDLDNNASTSSGRDATVPENKGTRKVGYHGNALPRSRTDFTWLDSEAAEQLLQDQERSFASKAKFPWATALSNSNSKTGFKYHNADNTAGGGDASMVRGGSMSLTREVGIIRLQ